MRYVMELDHWSERLYAFVGIVFTFTINARLVDILSCDTYFWVLGIGLFVIVKKVGP